MTTPNTEYEEYQDLISNIRSVITLTDEELDLVLQSFKIKKLKRKEILLFKGEISHHMRFVTDGCLRVYALNDEAQEHIVQFGIKGWWVNDLYSYLSEKPATYFIQAIKPTTVFQIHRDSLDKLFDTVPAIERFFRIKFSKAYVALQEQHLRNRSTSAKERYEQFRKTYPDMEQTVPQYMIASYLGVTAEFLSLLRKS